MTLLQGGGCQSVCQAWPDARIEDSADDTEVHYGAIWNCPVARYCTAQGAALAQAFGTRISIAASETEAFAEATRLISDIA